MFAKEKIIIRFNLLFRNLFFHLSFWYLSLLLFVFLTGNEQLFSKYVEILQVKSIFVTNLILAAILAILFSLVDSLFNDRLLRNSSSKLITLFSSFIYFVLGVTLLILAPLSPETVLAHKNIR